MSTPDKNAVPGQSTLPALEEAFGYGAITHLKPQQECFCWEFGLNGGNGKDAYQKAYPGTKDTSALSNSCRLLKSEPIQQRLTEIRSELQRRYAVDAQAVVRLLAMGMHLDRRLFVNEAGKPLDLHELPPEAAAITDIQIVIDRHGVKHALPVVPEKMKCAMELAKLMGIIKEKIELTGPNGGTVGADGVVRIYIPDNNRDDFEKLEVLREHFNKHLGPAGDQ